MKITTTENNNIQLEEVFNSIILKTASGEEMAICMRDSGFEFKYQSEMYFAKEGQVMPFHKSVREIIGYEIHTKKETFTGVSDFFLDEKGFVVCYNKNGDKFYIKKKLVKFIFPKFE